MPTEPATPQEKKPAPSRKVRLAWWFGIYYAGIVAFMMTSAGKGVGLGVVLWSLIWLFFLFPGGLGVAYGWIFPLIGFYPLALGLAYATYLVHLWFTSKAKTRRAFLLLMFSLILLVSMNVVSCTKMAGIPIDLQN